MTRTTVRNFALTMLAIVAAIAVAGCSDSSKSGASTNTDSTAAGRLAHEDGAIKLAGSMLTLTPASGDNNMTFALGPEVAKGTVQALVSTSARARVFYNADAKTSPLMAVAVEPAPIAGAGAKTYVGDVANVSTTSISINGSNGTKTFTIDAKDLPAFDVPHLKEHESLKSPVRVYYMGKGSTAHAVAYEDA